MRMSIQKVHQVPIPNAINLLLFKFFDAGLDRSQELAENHHAQNLKNRPAKS